MRKLYFSVYYFLTLSIVLFSLRATSKSALLGLPDVGMLHALFTALPYFIASLCLAGLMGHQKRWQLITTVLLLTLYTFVPYYFSGKTNNVLHAFIYGSLCLLFVNSEQNLNDEKNKSVLRIAQALILSTYFSAGVSKLVSLAKSHDFWGDLMIAPTQHVAYAVAEGNGPHPVIYNLLQQPSAASFLAAGFFAVLVFELLAAFVLFKTRYLKHYGLAIILFHLMSSLALGIWFVEAILASAFFLIFTENWIEAVNEQPLS